MIRRGITIARLGLSFDEGNVVSGIKEHEAKVLREIRQRDGDPSSPLAFDVCDEGEMKKIIAAEAKVKLGLTPEMMDAIREQVADEAPPAPVAPKPTRRGRQPA